MKVESLISNHPTIQPYPLKWIEMANAGSWWLSVISIHRLCVSWAKYGQVRLSFMIFHVDLNMCQCASYLFTLRIKAQKRLFHLRRSCPCCWTAPSLPLTHLVRGRWAPPARPWSKMTYINIIKCIYKSISLYRWNKLKNDERRIEKIWIDLIS